MKAPSRSVPRPAAASGFKLALRAALGAAAIACSALMPAPALAQVPPSAAEAARYTGLLSAAYRGDVAKLDRLIAAPSAASGSNLPHSLDQRDSHGRSAVHVAAFAGRHEVLRHLARAGADLGALENDRYDAVTIAAVADDEATLRVLLQLGASAKRVTSRYDGTALIAAAHLGHDGVVRQLIAAGAPLDHVNNLHWTAAIEAVVLGDGGPRHQATLRALIDAGADLGLTDANGQTPLALAQRRGFAEMVAMLQSAGGRNGTGGRRP